MLFPVVGKYKNESAQSMAIWKGKAYLFNNGGYCRVVNLENGDTEQFLSLGSQDMSPHMNSACFGSEMSKKSVVPYLYVAETRTPYRCFVECIQDTTSVVVQTIYPVSQGKPIKVTSWGVDKENGFIYALARVNSKKKDSDIIRIKKYNLPEIGSGSVIHLSEKDIIDSFVVRFASALQDVCIKNGHLYISSGFQQSSSNDYYKHRAVQIIDLLKKEIKKSIDLTCVTTNEPEGVDFWGDRLLIFAGQNGGIYEVKIE